MTAGRRLEDCRRLWESVQTIHVEEAKVVLTSIRLAALQKSCKPFHLEVSPVQSVKPVNTDSFRANHNHLTGGGSTDLCQCTISLT